MSRAIVRWSVVRASLALLWFLIASAATAQSNQPSGWADDLKLTEAVDKNPDPHVVEIDLDARIAEVQLESGERVQAWTYNGGIPGPLIHVHVGDRLIVHFLNHLPEPTTVHWHGIRVPFEMDGVPDHSQAPVASGESFRYDFIARDAGLFWYHPHVMSAKQAGFGLYGALLVEDSEKIGVDDELVVVLSDIGIGADGHTLEPPDSGGPAGMVFGHEGNRVLVNGRYHSKLTVRDGAPQRWRIVNAAKSRYFDLDLDGQPFTKIGGDGGLQEYAEQADQVVIAPGERVDLIVSPRRPSDHELVLRSLLYNRGYGSVEFRDVEDLFTIEFADVPGYSGAARSRVQRAIEPLAKTGAAEVRIELTLAQKSDGSFEYGINGVPFADGRPLAARVGETQVWTIVNKTKWSHPFHLHGFFFQVLDERGDPVRPLAWKDTVNVPLEQTVRLIVKFDERPGSWMYHCHILDHADGGLMGMVEVGASEEASSHHHTP